MVCKNYVHCMENPIIIYPIIIINFKKFYLNDIYENL